MREPRGYHRLGRRDLVVAATSLVVGCGGPAGEASCSRSRSQRASPKSTPIGGAPRPAWGVQSGEVTATRATIWSRSDRDSKMIVEWSTSPTFDRLRRVNGPLADGSSDHTARVALDGLPPGTRIHYRVRFDAESPSAWLRGTLVTPLPDDAARPRDVVFAWSGDVNGQGWGIDESRGGMPAYSALLDRAPEFFVSCGDAIYGDNPIPERIDLPGGSVWKNLVTEAKSHVAVTLDDFRGAHLYPRHAREFRWVSASVPSFAIWDDHEVRNNWFPGQILDDPRYAEKHVDALAVHARRAMFEHAPVLDPSQPIHRSFRWGPLLEVFLLDGRTFRTANEPSPEKESFLGAAQLAWLSDALVRSTATWKVVACDMPIGLVVSEPASRASCARGACEAFDGFANTSGPARGRELELARLFAALRERGVQNVVWLTADVHYAAAHRYDPARAAHKDMNPFWEFVAGPMHATQFPRKPFDDTFGPELAYASVDERTFGSPSDPGTQSFGLVRIDAKTLAMTVTLVDGRGRDLHTTTIPAAPR